jgi:hypothetical protein
MRIVAGDSHSVACLDVRDCSSTDPSTFTSHLQETRFRMPADRIDTARPAT